MRHTISSARPCPFSREPLFCCRCRKPKKSQQREAASKLLSEIAKKTNNPHLSALAVRIRLDAFVKVKKAIDDMIAELMKQKKDEIKHRDYCIENLNSNEADTERKDREKTDLLALIDELTSEIDTLTKEIETLKSEIAEMQHQLKIAGEDRELANKDFQTVVADQRASQDLLKQALKRLESFYKKALLQAHQEPGAAVPPPPPAFGEYKKNEGSGGVMTMIENVIKEAATSEKEAITDGADSQAGYESFMKNSNAAINKANEEIVSKTEQKAETEATMVQAKADLDSATIDAEKLATYKAELHESCDFVLKNFDTRQAARMDEIEGLGKAKAILSGSDFADF